MQEKRQHIDGKGKIVLITVFMTLLSTYPYVFSRFFPLPEYTLVMAAALLILVLVVSSIKTPRRLPRSFSYICMIQVVIYVFLSIYHLDSFYLWRFALFVFITYLSVYAINNTIGINRYITINNKWLTIQVVLGFIGFFLIISNIIAPIITFDIGEHAHDYFYGITTTNAIIGVIPRIAGYFDEPGALAQWGVFALVLNKISSHYEKRIEWLLIVGLIVTFSMAYYIQLIIYLILFYFSKIKRFMPIVITLTVVFSVAQNYIPEDSDLYHLTFRRFELSGGKFETNRDYSTELAKNFYKDNPLFGQGYSNLVNKGDYFYDNPYETLATSGIIGTFALYLPLLFILLGYRKHGVWQAVIVLAVGYLQRPFHIQFIHYLMMYVFFILSYSLNKKTKLFNYNKSSLR